MATVNSARFNFKIQFTKYVSSANTIIIQIINVVFRFELYSWPSLADARDVPIPSLIGDYNYTRSQDL